MKRTILALSILAAGAAHATNCANGATHASWPRCDVFPPSATQPSSSSASSAQSAATAAAAAIGVGVGIGVGGSANATGGDQRQQQGQAQQQAQRNDQRQQANGNGSGNSTGQAVTVQGAQAGSGDAYTDRSVAVAWAPIIPAPAAPALASANMVVVPGVCGPRHGFIRKDVQGRKFNSVQADESFAVGTNDVLFAEDVPFIERNGYLMGSLITEIHAVPGTSAAGGISIGAFSKGDGVQGGVNGSSSVQQVTTRYTIKDCVYAMPAPRDVDRPAPPRKADRN